MGRPAKAARDLELEPDLSERTYVSNRVKYRRLPDLYTVGTEMVFRDGTIVWLQVLNEYERDEARNDAAAARSRLTLALRGTEAGSSERDRVRGMFYQDRQSAVDDLLDTKISTYTLKVVDLLRSNPDWKERLEILARSQELVARPPEDAERQLLEKSEREYLDEVNHRCDVEREYWAKQYEAMDDETLWNEYLDRYLDERGVEVALREYKLTELWYSARICDGVRNDDDTWNHEACNSHRDRVFESKSDIRDLPDAMRQAMISKLDALNMSEREAKNLDRQRGSSASSPLPSEPEGLTPSTPTEIPVEPPGISSPLSTTP